MKNLVVSLIVLSALLLGAGLFHAGPAQAAFVTQFDIAGGELAPLSFGPWTLSIFSSGSDGDLVPRAAISGSNLTEEVWPHEFTGLNIPFLQSGASPLQGRAQVEPVPPAPPAGILFASGLLSLAGIVMCRRGPIKRQDLGFGLGVLQRQVACSGEVLFVSSDHAFAAGVAEQLQRSGYQSHGVASVTELLEMAQQRQPALILLDRRITDWDILRTDCALTHVPIITLAPSDTVLAEGDVIADLERGADGVYSCRDGHRLFVATIGAYLRRAGYDSARRGVYRVGGIELDADLHEVKIGEQYIQLSAKPFSILEALMSSPSRVFTRGELIDLVWGPGFAVGEHTLDVHIHAIRQQLERRRDHLCRLVSIKGVGFKLQAISSPTPTSGRVMSQSMPPMAADAELPLNSTLGRPTGVHAPLAELTVGATKGRVKPPACRRRARAFRKTVAGSRPYAIALAG
jgi:two-component system response regulator RegX3